MTLIERLEVGKPEEQCELLVAFWEACNPDGATFLKSYRYRLLLDCGAYLDAVMLLVPSWKIRGIHFNAPSADERKWGCYLFGGREGEKQFNEFSSTPALALAAAILKAKGDET